MVGYLFSCLVGWLVIWLVQINLTSFLNELLLVLFCPLFYLEDMSPKLGISKLFIVANNGNNHFWAQLCPMLLQVTIPQALLQGRCQAHCVCK